VAGGVFSDTQEAVATCVKPGGRVEPEPAWSAAYGEHRERYLALYPALHDIP
jgi:sugar (pentulose or hexulose) kinase